MHGSSRRAEGVDDRGANLSADSLDSRHLVHREDALGLVSIRNERTALCYGGSQLLS